MIETSRNGVEVARFLPPRAIPPEVHINLRNHRKIMIADGRVAFTGGMNIGDRHLASRSDNPKRVEDAHFRMVGPVGRQDLLGCIANPHRVMVVNRMHGNPINRRTHRSCQRRPPCVVRFVQQEAPIHRTKNEGRPVAKQNQSPRG